MSYHLYYTQEEDQSSPDINELIDSHLTKRNAKMIICYVPIMGQQLHNYCSSQGVILLALAVII